MPIKPHILLLSCFALSLQFDLRAEEITLTSTNNQHYVTFTVAANQIVELIAAGYGTEMHFTKPEHTYPFWLKGGNTSPAYPRLFTGPATVYLLKTSGGSSGEFATFRITPQAFQPDKTAIVPHLSNGANVALQRSTNLVDWVNSDNGIHSGTNGAVFFRIHLERAP